MAETINNTELYTSAQNNFKKLLEVAFSSEINSGQPLDDPQILQKIQEMTHAMKEPSNNCYIVPQLFRDSSEGNYQKIKEHIDNCCDVNEIGPDGETALACAINANNFQIVELLLKSGADPNIKPEKVESTPLMDAANVGYNDIVRILLDYGGSPDVKSTTNNTALHYAACGGHLDCCKLMLQYSRNPKALIEEQNENGHTALMEATTSGFLEMTKFLVENGAQINTPSAEFKETALTLSSYKGYSDIVQYLLEAGADHEHRTDEMHTALMEASMEGHIDAAKVLLYYGAQVNMRADSFESPLTLAACSGHSDLASSLISYGADIEEVNDESYTPLMEASREGHLDTVAMLLSLGANINRITEETQETALTLASCGGFYDIVLLLHRCGADIELGASTPLMEAAQEGHLEIVRALLAMGARVDAVNSAEETSLHFAAENGHVDVCRCLVEAGADVLRGSEGGKTGLMRACMAGNMEVVVMLVEMGARVDAVTTMGEHNALSMACANGHCKIVEYLLQVGADPTVKLKDNCTVLIEASRAGHIDVIEILLRDNKRDKRQQLNNQYLSAGGTIATTTASTTSNISQHDINKFMNIPVGIKMLPSPNPLCDYSSIYNDNCHTTPFLQHFPAQQQQFHSCSFSNSQLGNGNNDISSTMNSSSFARPLVLPTEIPDPPLNLPPLPPPSSHHSNTMPDDVNLLPMSIFSGPDNEKLLLQNMVDPHSTPNLEDWVKYMCPNFSYNHSNNLYANSEPAYNSSALSKLSLAQIDSTPSLTGNSNNGIHFHRKIKKAKHSENYNAQLDLMLNKDCAHSCQQQQQRVADSEHNGACCKFMHRCCFNTDDPIEDIKGVVKNSILRTDCNQNASDNSGHSCRDCNNSHVAVTCKETQLNDLNYPTKKNLFSATNNSNINKPVLTSGTSSTDSGVFSIDKSSVNVPIMICTTQNNYPTDTSSTIFNSVTASNISPIKPKITNQVSSTPFQKQVLQPKRRLQQNQRSPISNTSSLSTSSSLCSEYKMSPNQIKLSSQSESFFLPSTSLNGTVLDTAAFSTQPESSVSYNNFNFPEKSLSLEDRDIFLQQSTMLSDLSSDYGASLHHLCPLAGDCATKHGLLTPTYNHSHHHHHHHMDLMMSKMSTTNNLTSVSSNAYANLPSSDSIDNLEVVEEIDNEDNDEDDCDFDESDIEIDSGCVPPYNNSISSSTNNNNNQCCSKQNCSSISRQKRLNVNVCTELLQESPLSLACSGGHLEVVRLLINSGAKLEHRDKKSQTALHVAVLSGHTEVARALLEAGADIEAMVDRTKDTALSISCASGKIDLVELLASKGANIEHRNISDYTPLSLAASGGHVDTVRLLLANNAEINSRTNSKLGISPLMLAAMNGHLEAVTVLLDSGSDINAQIETNRNTALTLACFQGRSEVVALLVDRKAYIEHRAKSGLTPLMEASSQGHVEVGRILIAAGADVNAPPVPASRETALIIAAEKGHTDFVKLLLDHNAVVDARNKKGDSPLWLACNGGFIDVVKVLIDAMSDANSADNRRMTCLMAAFKRGHIKVVKELVKHVTQFPSEHDCLKHIKSVKNEDKDIVKKCETCKEIILKAKERQEYEAARNAKDLLKQVEEERKAKEQKEVKQAKKREKKKAKKKAKHEDKDCDMSKSDDRNAEEDIISPKEELPTVINVVTLETTEYVDLQSSHNNENINPDQCVPTKSNKRSRPKHDLEKNKPHVNDEVKSDKCINDALLKSPVHDLPPVTDIDVSANKTTLSISNDIGGHTNPKNGSKNNSWIEIGPTKVTYGGNKLEENNVSNWQKISGSKKKFDIQVNKKDIGKVIGQGGSVVNAIRHITAAHIDIDSMANDLDERTVHLKGTLESVTKAKDYICDLVDGSITGSAVIKESEPFVSKTALTPSKSTIDYSIPSSSNIELDYSKSVHLKNTSTPIRQNGKVNKFGYTKFGSPSSTTATSIVNNGGVSLQYGFSKSGKSSDFASVAAAGIVNVSSPVYQTHRIKYPEKTIDSFPSLSESNSAVIYPLSEKGKSAMTVTMNSNNTHTQQSSGHIVSEPLEVNINMIPSASTLAAAQSHNNISKSFPLAPGSERSLHQRTYNSTPEHSPQIVQNEPKGDMESSTVTSSNSDRDDSVDVGGGGGGCGLTYPISMNNSTVNNWSIPPLGGTFGFQDQHINFANNINSDQQQYQHQQQPVSILDFEMMSRFPKLQSLNPKAEAFSPSIVSNCNSQLYNLKPEDFYYNMNGTLTLNPTANIFKPRLQGYNIPGNSHHHLGNNSCGGVGGTPGQSAQCGIGDAKKNAAPVTAPSSSTTSTTTSSNTTIIVQPSATNHQVPMQEERLIRLQDHINMAITILLRNNGFDHHMAEAAFSSFMRSANHLDLNTRLTTTEFTSLINNIINQSNNPPPPASVVVQPPPLFTYPVDDGRVLPGYRHQGAPQSSSIAPAALLINQSATVAPQTHWPQAQSSLVTSQSIWAPQPQPINNVVSPFFPNLSQCVSAQAAFNSTLAFTVPPPLAHPQHNQHPQSIISTATTTISQLSIDPSSSVVNAVDSKDTTT